MENKTLVYLKNMKRDYFISLLFPFMKLFLDTFAGFCHYNDVHNGSIRFNLLVKDLDMHPGFNYGNYWWKPGKIYVRYRFLCKLIKAYEERKD